MFIFLQFFVGCIFRIGCYCQEIYKNATYTFHLTLIVGHSILNLATKNAQKISSKSFYVTVYPKQVIVPEISNAFYNFVVASRQPKLNM